MLNNQLIFEFNKKFLLFARRVGKSTQKRPEKCEILIKHQLENTELSASRVMFTARSPSTISNLLEFSSLSRVTLMYAHRFEFHLTESEAEVSSGILIVVLLHHTPCSRHDKESSRKC